MEWGVRIFAVPEHWHFCNLFGSTAVSGGSWFTEAMAAPQTSPTDALRPGPGRADVLVPIRPSICPSRGRSLQRAYEDTGCHLKRQLHF